MDCLDIRRAVCPICGKPTKIGVSPDSILLHFPLFCENCNQLTVINMAKNQMAVEKTYTSSETMTSTISMYSAMR